MSQEIDYPTKLKKILWERLKINNESFEKFEKRIEGSFFSDKVLDYPLLLQIIKNTNDTEFTDIVYVDYQFRNIVYHANDLFLKIFESKAKSRLNEILRKVNKITETHDQRHYFKNFIIFILLSIFFGEVQLKYYAKYVNSELSPAIQKAIKQDLRSFISSINDLLKVFSPNYYPHEYYLEKIINPIKDKAIQCGLSKEKLEELVKFIEQHESEELLELRQAEYTDVYAKREQDYSPLSRANLILLFNFMKEKIGIKPEQAKRYIAELFDLFEIRRFKDIIREHAQDESFSDQHARKILAKRIGDVIHKAR